MAIDSAGTRTTGGPDPAQRLQVQLGSGVRVFHLQQVGSTSMRLKELVLDGRLEGPTLLICDHQTAGRGTRGRAWMQPPPEHAAGGTVRPRDLALTYAVPFTSPPDPRLSLAIGAIVADALTRATKHAVYLKWPNDLLAGSGAVPALTGSDHASPQNQRPEAAATLCKVGGILVETSSGWLLAGVGVNVNSAPADYPADIAPRLTTLSSAAHKSFDVAFLQLAIASALAQQLPQPDLERWMQRWLELDRTAGTQFTLMRDGRRELVTAREVLVDGSLVLSGPGDELHTVSSYSELDPAPGS